MRRRILVFTCILLSLLIYHKTEAATTVLYNSGGDKVIGILDILISGEHYNVDFVYDSYDAIWGSGFDVPDASMTSITAALAINGILNSESIIPGYIEDDTSGEADWEYNIPWGISNLNEMQITFGRNAMTGSWFYGAHVGNAPDSEFMYARLESVPIPGAVWLLGSGLIGIVGVRRKFKK